MIPIHELLSRIRWDPEFAKGDFQLGYYDRAEDRIILVPFQELTFPDESPQTFQLTDLERAGPSNSLLPRARGLQGLSTYLASWRGLGIFLTWPYPKAIAISCWNNWGG
jgi:hypothetical protein